MKKFLLLLVVLGGAAFSSFAQTAHKGKLSIGFDAGLPIDITGDLYSVALGGSLRYDHPVAENIFVNISGGYTSFMFKSEIKDYIGQSASGYVPVKAGAKFRFAKTFYGEAQLGAVFSTDEGGTTFLAHSTGFGFDIAESVDLGIRYESWTSSGVSLQQIAVRLAYTFK